MSEKTFAIIKPDAVAEKNAGNIISMIEASGLNIIAVKKLKLTAEQAGEFYGVHKEKPFFGECGGSPVLRRLHGSFVIGRGA